MRPLPYPAWRRGVSVKSMLRADPAEHGAKAHSLDT